MLNALQNARRIDKDDEEIDEKKFDPSTQTDMMNCFGFDVSVRNNFLKLCYLFSTTFI